MSFGRRGLTKALVVMLADVSTRSVGEGRAPGDENGSPEMPYYVVWAITGGEAFGDMADPHRDGRIVYQVDTVAATQEQAEFWGDRARQAILGIGPGGYTNLIVPDPTPGLPDVEVCGRDLDTPGGVEREGAVFTFSERYGFLITA